MRLSTVWIRNKRTGDRKKINEHEWAGDLGTSRYAGWERVSGETHGEESEKDVAAMRKEEEVQEKKLHPQTIVPELTNKEDSDIEEEREEGLPTKPVAAGTGARRKTRGRR